MPRRPPGWQLLVALALLAGPAAADDPSPWDDTQGPVVPLPQAPEPFDLEVPVPVLDAKLAELVREARWAELVELLQKAADLPLARSRAGAIVGGRELVRRRLLRLPPAARAAWEALVEPRARKLLQQPPDAREAGLLEALARWGATPSATKAARLLGERLLERGDVHGAALLWRRLAAEQPAPDPALEARLLALRTHLPYGATGSLRPTAPALRGWGALWARPLSGGDELQARAVAADGHRVYVTDHRGVLALDRQVGRLVWRAPARGDMRQDRLVVGLGRLVLLRRDRIVGIDAERGVILWERPAPAPADRWLDVVATPVGFAVLAVVDRQRVLVGLGPEGRTLFEQRLWPVERDDQLARPVGLRRPGDPMRNAERPYEWPLWGRRVVGDGRLAAVGDLVVVDADGLLAAASALTGGVAWLRDRTVGVEVAGRRIFPAVAAGAWAVEAVTAAGHVVRVDPLDGKPLADPSPPPGAWPELPGDLPSERTEQRAMPARVAAASAGPPRPFVLSIAPLVLGWQPEEPGGAFWIGVGASFRGETRLLTRFAQRPAGPGAVVGQVLALPDPEGVVLVDLGTGAELGDPLPWTLARGPLVERAGLLVAAGPEGLVVFGPDAPMGAGEEPDDPVRGLDADDWRVRLRAREALAARGDQAQDELARLAREGASLEARDAAQALVERLRRERAFGRLARLLDGGRRSSGTEGLLLDLTRGVNLPDRLRSLRLQLPATELPASELEDLNELVRTSDDPEVRWLLLEVLLKLDRNLRRGVAGYLGDMMQDRELRLACAVALVDVAARSGPRDELVRLLEKGDDATPDLWTFLVPTLQASGDTKLLEQLFPDEDFGPPAPLPEGALEAGRVRLLEAHASGKLREGERPR